MTQAPPKDAAVELLPCPFCGGPAALKQIDPSSEDEWQVNCNNDDCLVSGPIWPTAQSAIITWNTRAPTTPARVRDDAAVEAVARAISPFFECDMAIVSSAWIADIARAAISALADRDDFYAGRYAERCGDVLRLQARNAALEEGLRECLPLIRVAHDALNAVTINRQRYGAIATKTQSSGHGLALVESKFRALLGDTE